MKVAPKALVDLEVLVLDAQTSGAAPPKGRLIEVGWATMVAASDHPCSPEAYLLRLPEGERIPPAVCKLTGIQLDEVMSGELPADVWQRLSATADAIRARTGAPCTAVIHYARFEQAFFERWHAACAPDRPFPFDILCTHAIARRLLPDLPRCGLRALAGYFGAEAGPFKRCAPHVKATARIWKRLVARLAQIGVRDIAALKHWLQAAPHPTLPSRVYPMATNRYRGIPDRPGVYRFRRSSGELLYIGKAKSLKHRVGSYFQRRRRHSERILEMLTQAVDLDWSETGTVLEAALREAEEIRARTPLYNRHLQAIAGRPVFSSQDFQRTGQTAESGLAVGPFPSKAALEPLATLARCLIRPCRPPQNDAPDILAALGLSPERQPPVDLLGEALDCFRQRHALPQGGKAVARRLMFLGAYWWRLRRTARPKGGDEVATETPPETTWTHAAMMHFLRGVVSQGTFLARRGHWFTLLCEATLTWEKGQGGGRAATLTIAGGRMGRVAPLAHVDGGAPPGRYGLTPPQRRVCFDAATYSRLRVLTTEIRRLVAAGRGVRLRLTPRMVLDEIALERQLFWI